MEAEPELGLRTGMERQFEDEPDRRRPSREQEEERTALLPDPDGTILAERGPWGRFGKPGRNKLDG